MSKTKNKLISLCVCSVLAALFVALEWVAMYTGKVFFADTYQLPISCFPLILASVMFGIFWGGMTAIVGSFLSQLVFYSISIESILWMLPTICYGFTVAILYLLFKKSDNPILLAPQLIISSLILSAMNVLVNYYFNYITSLSNGLLKMFIPVKIASAVISAIIFAIIVPPIIKKLKKVLKF